MLKRLGIKADVDRIAQRLGETERTPRHQIALIVELCGVEFADFMLENTRLIEENGGMMTANGKRRRSVGGTYLYLVRHSLPYDLRRAIFPPNGQSMRSLGTSQYDLPAFRWKKRKKYFKHAFKNKGKVQNVHIQIEGRPGHIQHRDDVYIVTMQQAVKELRTFPQGVPDVPDTTTKYVAYIGYKQWKKHVKNKLKNDDKTTLILRGATFMDTELDAIGILVEAVSTGKLKPKPPKEEENKEEKEEKEEKKEEKPDKQKTKPQDTTPSPEEIDEAKLEDIPDDIAKKLRPLYGARRLFEKRLADIQARPEEKQKGLKAAQMMLDRTEQQIAELEEQAAKEPEDTATNDDNTE